MTAYNQNCDGTLAFAGGLVKKPIKLVAGTLSFVGALKRATTKKVAGALSFVSTLTSNRYMILLFSKIVEITAYFTKTVR